MMLFIHGRGQEGKDPARLERAWRAGLAAGLVEAGRAPLDTAAVAFPYYGNVLHDATLDAVRRNVALGLELPVSTVDDPEELPLHAHLGTDVGAVERALIADMALATAAPREEGIDRVLSWSPARRALVWLSRHTRVDREIIKGYLQDVAVYLTVGRDAVLAQVRSAVPPDGPLVVVSHSLGTIVAHDLLQNVAIRDRVTLWVTAGSPLGLPTVQRNLVAGGAKNPGVPWLSAYDVNDIVSLGHPLRPAWGEPLEEIAVENGDAPHAIERYLGHAGVAGRIGRAVAAGALEAQL